MIQSPRRTVLAGLIGNVMEWFDFAVYGYFASVIGGQFFPESSPAAQQLLAFTVFALGFGARPIGSLVLGAIGDRIGRRALLVWSIALMGGATLLIGLLPNYASIGVAAPHPAGHAAPAAGILGGRRIHGLHGLHHRACSVGNPWPRQQLRGGGCHAGLHPRLGLRLA